MSRPAGKPWTRYGWLGGAQRSAEALGGVILMGVRLYHTDTGRFLQPDPVDGGSATTYDYCNADPVNCTDLAGTWPNWSAIKKAVTVVAKVAEIASMIPGPIGTIAGVVSAVSYAATGNWQAAAWAVAGAAAAMVGAGVAVKAAKIAVTAVRASRATKAAAAAAKAARSCTKNSFSPDTPVVMADGSHEPISAIIVGDYVVAVDPSTGARTSQPVLDVIVGQGTKHLVDIKINDAETVLTATAAHPTWVVGRGWTEARNLTAGDQLLADDGTVASIRSVRDLGEVAGQTVYNLNVGNIHTFVVVAGEHSIVVHNTSELCKRPGSFRAGVANEVLDRARDAAGLARCTTCGAQIGGRVRQGSRWFRDWDVDHIFKVRKLQQRLWASRKRFLDAYNHVSNLRARCQACNRADQ